MRDHTHSPSAGPKDRDTRIIESSGNVFADLGFDPVEAEVLKLRAEVMIRTAEQLKARGWTQAEAARQLGWLDRILTAATPDEVFGPR